MSEIASFVILFSSLRLATPLVFAALGGLISERSGIVQLALEGYLILGAFVAATVAYFSQSPWLGMFSAALVCGGVGIVQWVFSDLFKANQIVLGTGINIFSFGITAVFSRWFFGTAGSTPALPMESRLTFEPTVLAVVVGLLVWYVYRYSRAGLWLKFSGDNPLILETSGISAKKFRCCCLFLTGFLTGLGGASLSVYLSSSFTSQISAGRGFMALAAMIFGSWRPTETLLVCLLFAFTDAMQIQLQGQEGTIPVQFIQMIPYIMTIAAVALVGPQLAPKNLGKSL